MMNFHILVKIARRAAAPPSGGTEGRGFPKSSNTGTCLRGGGTAEADAAGSR